MSVKKEHLLSTYWIQCDKVVNCGSNENLENGIHFNEYAPLDFYTSEAVRSYTGCISTAVSQVIYYHLMNDYCNDLSYDLKLDVLTDQDAYVSFASIPALTSYISADGNSNAGTLSFAEINQKLSVFVPAPTDPEAGDYDLNSLAAADYIAALHFTVGVLHQANYSNIFETGAIYSADVFLRFGFQSASDITFIDLEGAERNLWMTEDEQLTDEAFEVLIENLEKDNPIAFGLPGHAVVLDGYDSNTDMFHINYGMGQGDEESVETTRWYTRDEVKELRTSGFVIDISPVYQETFTVTNNRVFGSGTLLRVVQQTAAMQGENIIVFDDALAKSDALELPLEVKLYDKTTIFGFNMTVFTALQDTTDDAPEKKAANPDEEDEESEEENESLAAFFGENGSRTEFANFCGSVICNYQEKSQGAAFYFSEAIRFGISTSNAMIYAGVSQFENSDILSKMNSGSLDALLANSQKKVAFAGSDGDDQIVLDAETLVIGNVELAEGHDTLTLAGNSHLYGDIDLGSGDNAITISAGSSVHGNLNSAAELFITICGTNTSALFDITGDANRTLENILSITIDATNAEAEEYILFNKGNVELLLKKLQIKGNGGIVVEKDGTIKWSAAGTYLPVTKEDDKPEETIITAGETVSNAVVGADEIWIFQDGSTVSGSLSIAENGEVKVMTGAKFIFDISTMSAANTTAVIDHYSKINGTFHFSVNIAKDQAYGTYILAENMEKWDFNTPICVTTENLTLGTFENEQEKVEFYYGDNHYELVYHEENKTLSFVIDSAFQTAGGEDNSIDLTWHNPFAATGYFVNISRSDNNGIIQIFTRNNGLNIVTAAPGEYTWQVLAPGLDTKYRDGGGFSIGKVPQSSRKKVTSTLYQAGASDDITDVFIAESSETWGSGYLAQHMELPENLNKNSALCTQVDLTGKTRYSDLFYAAEDDIAILYLSDSENGDALFLDDVYSAFPDQDQCERIANIEQIYAGAGNDIIDLTTDKFNLAAEDLKVYGGAGDDVIWTGAETAATLYGDEGNDCLIGSGKNDCFIGGAGDDVMHGGGGEDIFAYGDPATWGNDIIYQLTAENDVVELAFEQTDLQDRIRKENIDGGVRITVDGYENSSITIYCKYYSFAFGSDCQKMEALVEGGGCNAYASQTIFENKNNGSLA